jgi:hypothetical protein
MSTQPSVREHLGDRLSDYVDRAMPDQDLWVCDRHVLICPSCGEAVAEERRLLESLRRLDGVPPGGDALRQALLQLGAEVPLPEEPGPERLPVLHSGAPAMHRSARLSLALAGSVAAACAVAAWAVAGAQPLPDGGTTPVAHPSRAVVRPVDLSTSMTAWSVAPAGSALFEGDHPEAP